MCGGGGESTEVDLFMIDSCYQHGTMERLIWSIGIKGYWNDGFMDRYYPDRGWRSVRLRRT
jgi:hypothetical protein